MPVEVVLNKQQLDGSDSSLAAAWRFNSDEKIKSEISRELEEIDSLLEANTPFNKALINSKRNRVQIMYRVQEIRKMQKFEK